MDEARKKPLALRLGQWAADRVQKRWLPPTVSVFPAADFLLPVMPNQLLLAGLSMLAPARWWLFTLFFALGTALGAGLVAVALQSLGIDQALFMGAEDAGGPLAEATAQFTQHGLWFLAGMSLLPWTPRLTVVACALLGFAPLVIVVTVFGARLVPCTVLALLGGYGLPWAARMPLIGKIGQRVGEAIGPRQ